MKQINPGTLAALMASAVFAFMALPTWAHGDEDHSQDKKPASTASPSSTATGVALQTTASQRLPDGSLFVPKAVQRQLGIRTVLVEVKDLAASVEFNGRVIADPNASGRVQASQSGRVEAGPKGLPTLGQRVAKDQVLLWLRPTIGSVERGSQRAALAELTAQLAIAERKAARYAELEGSVPQKEIDAARFELVALTQRRAAISAGIGEAEALTAPVSGVVSAAHVVSGQVVESGAILLEIIDPARLAVEALAYDPALVEGIATASVPLVDGSLELQFVGSGKQMREQALPLLFRVKSQNAPVAVGQPVKVIAKTSRMAKGMAVPVAALARNSAGESVVWVHISPERFVQRRVSAQPLDAKTLVVTTGVIGGDRVVSQGSNLLAQVR
ncbi:MAG: HlyD family efflux transporter periplasmic adaptor subunit [Rhodoferax sp.]|nr:HlyD family efflux transporter periplasmic adaptor subunit [Rhodoferax sp.]